MIKGHVIEIATHATFEPSFFHFKVPTILHVSFPQILGMTCSSCVHSIESNVKKRPGIIDVSVALTTERGKVKFDPTVIGELDTSSMVYKGHRQISVPGYLLPGGCTGEGVRHEARSRLTWRTSSTRLEVG